MTSSRKVSDLLPVVAKRCQAFVGKAQAEGIEVIITSTYRDSASQNALYAQGRTKPGKVVTRARAGQSYHCLFALALLEKSNGKTEKSNEKSKRNRRTSDYP